MTVKRSLTVSGHRTSVTLEDEFWQELADIAAGKQMSVAALVAKIDADRSENAPATSQLLPNLSSAVRLYILQDLKKRADTNLTP